MFSKTNLESIYTLLAIAKKRIILPKLLESMMRGECSW